MIGGSWSMSKWNTGGNIAAIVLLTMTFKNILNNDYRQEDE
jgi:hypothetical protein